jgi:hypothetical protein
MAAFHVFDLEMSKRVFAVCGTSTRAFALHEQLGLGGGGAGRALLPRVESTYRGLRVDKDKRRSHQ